MDPRTPVIVGAGQVVQRPGEGAQSPVELTVEALRRAAVDAGPGEQLLRRADSVRQVATTGWLYRDEAQLVAAALGATPRETVRTIALGGDGPGRMLGDSARSIASGEADIVLLGGGEALATLTASQRSGERPHWPEQPDGAPARVVGVERTPVKDEEIAVGLVAPLNVYALFETALRGAAGEGRAEHLAAIAQLWSRFSEVAAVNPFAWLPKAHSAEQIARPANGNRMVSEPYSKLLSANIHVDLAAALILCSAETARTAGVPRERWVFPLACASAQDEWFFSERAELVRSPAIRAASRAALGHAGVAIDEVAHIDLYSCFPSAVEIAARELGISVGDPARPLTLTGGLTFAGGPGNNYAMHGLATLIGRLREDPAACGLSSALGWYMTKHAYCVVSATPGSRPFAEIDAQDLVEAPAPRPSSIEYAGEARLEAYTVPYSREGAPEALVASAIAPDGTRVLVRDARPETATAVLDTDPLGETVMVSPGALDLV